MIAEDAKGQEDAEGDGIWALRADAWAGKTRAVMVLLRDLLTVRALGDFALGNPRQSSLHPVPRPVVITGPDPAMTNGGQMALPQ